MKVKKPNLLKQIKIKIMWFWKQFAFFDLHLSLIITMLKKKAFSIGIKGQFHSDKAKTQSDIGPSRNDALLSAVTCT